MIHSSSRFETYLMTSIGPIPKFDLRSSQVKVTWWFRSVMLHISRCALAEQTYWYHSHVCVSIQSKVIDKKGGNTGAMCPLERSYEVTSVVFVNKFWLNRDTDTGFVPVFVSSRRIGWYATWPTWTNTLPWPEMTSCQTSKLTHRSHQVYASNRLDERITSMLKELY